MCDKINVKYNRRRRLVRNYLGERDKEGQIAFENWLATHRNSKKSQQVDLPSSQIPTKMEIINTTQAQLFAIIDTCSIVSNRNDFIDYVTHLKTIFPGQTCPIKLIVSIPVLEELDKCNRPKRKRESFPVNEINNNNNNNISDPPRNFMRFIEEEMRVSQIIISELDPFKNASLSDKQQSFEIINKDDRILDCCLRTQAFLNAHRRHADTKVILISEDNVFKAKATTHEVISFRWKEFRAKYKNYGHKNYAPTPLFPNGIPARASKSKIYDPRWLASPKRFFGKPKEYSESVNVSTTPVLPTKPVRFFVPTYDDDNNMFYNPNNLFVYDDDKKLVNRNNSRQNEEKKKEDNDDVIFVKEVINMS